MENKDFEQSEESKMKKIYNTPKIETIGDMRSATKGSGAGLSDLGGESGDGIPYEPQ